MQVTRRVDVDENDPFGPQTRYTLEVTLYGQRYAQSIAVPRGAEVPREIIEDTLWRDIGQALAAHLRNSVGAL